jgi:hypothetical protein
VLAGVDDAKLRLGDVGAEREEGAESADCGGFWDGDGDG